MKLSKRLGKLNVRKHSFGLRVTNNWNSLPKKVVCVKTTNEFETNLTNSGRIYAAFPEHPTHARKVVQK
jgi:hypothetical protein